MNTQEKQNNEEMDNTETTGTEESLVGLEAEERSLGQITGIVIVVFILVLGGLYFWGTQYFTNTENIQQQTIEEMDPVVESLEAQSASDELNSIEEDLTATDLNNIDEDLSNIDTILVQ